MTGKRNKGGGDGFCLNAETGKKKTGQERTARLGERGKEERGTSLNFRV